MDRARAAIEIDPNDADAQAIMAFALWIPVTSARPGNERPLLLRTTPTRHGQTASKARCSFRWSAQGRT